MTICRVVLLMQYGGAAFVSPGSNGLWVGNAGVSLFRLDLRRQRRADRRLVGLVEVVRARGRRCHRSACGDQGRDVTADRSGIVMLLPHVRAKEWIRAVG